VQLFVIYIQNLSLLYLGNDRFFPHHDLYTPPNGDISLNNPEYWIIVLRLQIFFACIILAATYNLF